MKVYIVRHGQVLARSYYGGDVMFPAGDEPLSELGVKQAEYAGRRLKVLGFHGKIYASPYRRTMQTASVIAEILDLPVTPLPCLREIFKTERSASSFVGMKEEELCASFPRTALSSPLPYPWWEAQAETMQDVTERVRNGIAALSRDTDVLFVGHGASSMALYSILEITRMKSTVLWNCSIGMKDTESGENYRYDADFLPKELRTSNALTYLELQSSIDQNLVELSDFVSTHKGTRLLHIGDTYSFHYGEYRRLIETAKPDIIVHTGDLADELKAGRLPQDIPLWREKAQHLISILKESGATVYIVAGNNDIESELVGMAEGLHVVPRNTVPDLQGKRTCLCHEVSRINADAEVYFYGHGLTGEPRTPETRTDGNKSYFNVIWGATLHINGEFFEIPRYRT